MKKSFIITFIILASLFVIIPNFSFAITSKGGYTISNYDIEMKVNENNSFDITEKITVNFEENKHGIFRKLPLKNEVKRLDGTKSKNRVTISNIEVSENYTTSRESGNLVIKIGDASKTVIGNHIYTIKYNYSIGKDPLKDADELYYNLIGNDWDTSIESVNFKIIMPKEFDSNLLGFSWGYKESADSSNISYNIDGNVITGYTNVPLKASQGLTIRMTLKEGYFVFTGLDSDFIYYIIIAFCLVCIIITFVVWKKYGKDLPVVETVEFYPPENLNSAEIGYIYDGEAKNRSVISLLIYLADKGYIRLEENEEKGLFKKSKGFKIVKVKEYDGNSSVERSFFEGLFRYKRNVDYKEINKLVDEAEKRGEKLSYQEAKKKVLEDSNNEEFVTSDDLYDNFYTVIDSIKRKLDSKSNRKEIFETASIGKRIIIYVLIALIFILITVKPVLDFYVDPELLIFALVFPGVGFTVLFKMIFGKTNLAVKVFGLVWGLGFGGGPWSFIVLPALLDNPISLVTYIFGIGAVGILAIFSSLMEKRTPYGTEMLGKIRGFKRFLETAEKEQLEKLVEQSPEYFYHILPYTYALGVSDKWVKKFETIALKSPDWYYSDGDFTVSSFGSFMHSAMASTSSAMSSSPSSSSSGSGGSSSSGGGSSGGGSGGGGGGSW